MLCETFVWTVELTEADEPLAEWLAVLNEEEIARSRRFRLAHDRVSFAAAHALKRLAIASLAHVQPVSLYFDADVFGKPRLLQGGSWRFNLSHTRGAVAFAAAANSELGIDIEQIDRAVSDDELAAEVCTGPERSMLRAMSGAARLEQFIALWTAKEAVVKAEGLGLSLPLTRVHLTPDGDAAEVVAPSGEPVRRWALWRCRPTARHLLSLAVPPTARLAGYCHLTPPELTAWALDPRPDATKC